MVKDMERITVSVRIPALGGSYEFLTPDSMAVKNVKKLMIRILSSEFNVHPSGDYAVLIDLRDHRQLLEELSFRQQGIEDGAELLLL